MAGMKSQQPDPNMIDIHIEGYSSNCCKGKFDGKEMDPRLMYYMTAEEYQGTLVKLNDELGRSQKSVCVVGHVLALITVMFTSLSAIMATFVYSPEVIECGAPKGFCSNTTLSPIAGQCCLVHCCIPNEAEHAEAGQFLSAASCYRVGPEWAVVHHVTGEAQVGCACSKKKGKKPGSCSRDVKYEGELKITAEKNGWAHPFAILIGVVAGLSFICNFVQCSRPHRYCGSLQSKLALHWVIWQSKGIAVSFSYNGTPVRGPSKKSQPRLILVMPAGGPHMQGGCVGDDPQPVTVGQTWPARNEWINTPLQTME